MRLLLLVLLIHTYFIAITQTSFSRIFTPTLSLESGNWFGFSVDKQGNTSVTGFSFYDEVLGGSPVILIETSSTGEVTGANFIYTSEAISWNVSSLKYGVERSGDFTVIQSKTLINNDPLTALFVVNQNDSIYWCKQIFDHPTYLSENFFAASGSGTILTAYLLGEPYNTPAKGYALLDIESGAVHWANYYKVDNPVGITLFPSAISYLQNSTFLICHHQGIITRLSMSGQVEESFQINPSLQPAWNIVEDEQGYIYISAMELASNLGHPNVVGLVPIVMKFNSQLQLIWSKAILVENFPVLSFDLVVTQNNELIIVCSTVGEMPITSIGLTEDGALLWERGYARTTPLTAIAPDGSLYFRSLPPLSSQSSSFYLTKTNVDGTIDGCDIYSSCSQLLDFDITLNNVSFTIEEGASLPNLDILIKPLEVQVDEHCESPPPPNAYFSLPKATCAGTYLSPDSLYNYLAQRVEWRILGPSTDTLIVDSSFVWCFNIPGTFTIEQEIWSLGCSEFYTRQLEVLPDDLTPPLMSDTILCQSPPYTLQPQSSRPLSSFLWSDGSMGPVLSVNQGGVITLEAGDGACTVRDTLELQFVEELIPQGPYAQPEDVGLCEQLLPYVYNPYSNYTSEFSLPGAEALPDGSFLLSEYGRYELSTELYGCPFSTTWELQELPCELPVYLPNAFSPNFDGINDHLEPQGIDFEPIRLQVFDRWGGLLFQTNQAPFRWDGIRANQPINSGVYVVRFEYRNLRTGGVEEVVGEVVVVR
jgi:gliding motility-associated-like protein